MTLGSPIPRLHRGTSQLENFHRIQERILTGAIISPLLLVSRNAYSRVLLLTGANISPEVIHYTAIDFNILWNLNKRRQARAGQTNELYNGLHCMDLDLLNSLNVINQRAISTIKR